jgi:hypothetical protein
VAQITIAKDAQPAVRWPTSGLAPSARQIPVDIERKILLNLRGNRIRIHIYQFLMIYIRFAAASGRAAPSEAARRADLADFWRNEANGLLPTEVVSAPPGAPISGRDTATAIASLGQRDNGVDHKSDMSNLRKRPRSMRRKGAGRFCVKRMRYKTRHAPQKRMRGVPLMR